MGCFAEVHSDESLKTLTGDFNFCPTISDFAIEFHEYWFIYELHDYYSMSTVLSGFIKKNKKTGFYWV